MPEFKLRHIGIRSIPRSIQEYHRLAEMGQADKVTGKKVKFDLSFEDNLGQHAPILEDAETLWLIYRGRR